MAPDAHQARPSLPPTIADGAYGTALGVGHRPADMACVTDPDAVVALHEAYLSAGARQVQTNSFMAWSLPAAERRGVYEAALRCAYRAAAGATTPARVVATIGPVPGSAADVGAELELVLAAGAEAVLFETITTRAGAEAAHAAWTRADTAAATTAVVSLSVSPARTHEDWSWLGQLEPASGLTYGLNCCEGATPGLRAPLELLAATHGSLHVAPSAGLPGAVLPPAAWAKAVVRLADGLPVGSLGGCCGSTVAHVAALAAEVAPGLPAAMRTPSRD